MSPSNQRTVYATDEDLAIRVGADFAMLCPADQVVAAGADGSFAPTDAWTLSSASVDFSAHGAQPGQMVLLRKPSSHFGPQGTLLAIQTVNPSGLTLRRKGLPAQTGQPPAPAGGLTGVDFLLATFAPQLQRASLELDRRFGIDPSIPGRTASDLRDVSPLRDAAVLFVLGQQYLLLSRSGQAPESASMKGRAFLQELDDLLPRIALGWSSGAGPVTRFSTRLVR